MDEVQALEQRHAGEGAERGVDKIERVPHPAHTGVGMIAGDDGIAAAFAVLANGLSRALSALRRQAKE